MCVQIYNVEEQLVVNFSRIPPVQEHAKWGATGAPGTVDRDTEPGWMLMSTPPRAHTRGPQRMMTLIGQQAQPAKPCPQPRPHRRGMVGLNVCRGLFSARPQMHFTKVFRQPEGQASALTNHFVPYFHASTIIVFIQFRDGGTWPDGK